MSKKIFITLNNSGNDPGPYIITLYDAFSVPTIWGTSPTKAQLTAGYQMIIPDNIVTVRVKSITCTSYATLTVPIVPTTTTSTTTTTTSTTTSTTTTTTTAPPTTTTTTICTRPLKTKQFYMLRDIELNSVLYNSEGEDKIYTCNLYSLIRDWGIPAISGTIQGEVSGNAGGLTVGKTVYEIFNDPSCYTVEDGAYIYLDEINIITTNPVTYCLDNNPIEIITIVGGVVTEISTCYYSPAPGDNNLVVLNNTPTGIIESISPITYTLEIVGSIPVLSDALAYGTHTGFTGALVVVITDVEPGNIGIYNDGILVECITTSGTGTYTFSSHTWTSVQELRIVYSIGSCL